MISRVLDGLLDRSVVLGYGRPGLAVRKRLPSWPDDPAPGSLVGRDAVVTGASSGLGVATAAGLADLGARVHLVVRDLGRGERARGRIRAQVPGADLRLWRCDVADLDDVRRFAEDFGAEVGRLHALVHNAGLMPPHRTESPQGFEMTMAVHVLGPVLMTHLLAQRLAGGRVVFVSSGGMYAQRLRADDPDYLRGDYSPTTAYARSKRLQVELTSRLADRWSDVMVATMHPGWADTPGVQDSLPGFRRLTRPILRDDAEGADTSVWLAAAQPEPDSGLFWHDRAPRPTHLMPSTRASAAEVERAWTWLWAALEPWSA